MGVLLFAVAVVLWIVFCRLNGEYMLTYEEAKILVFNINHRFKCYRNKHEDVELSELLKREDAPDNCMAIKHDDYGDYFRVNDIGGKLRIIPVGVTAMSPDYIKDFPVVDPEDNKFYVKSYKDDFDW